MSVKFNEGLLKGEGFTFAIVLSRFNDFISNALLAGSIDMLKRHNVDEGSISIYKVPGSFELPLICKKLAFSNKFDAIISLGAVIRGDTPHFDYIASEVSKGIAKASYDSGVPIIFGILTTDTIEQAIERAGTKAGNKGSQAALNALEMVNLIKDYEL
jgi:6,7-dimethyl-8-ribityllumazine synthase